MELNLHETGENQDSTSSIELYEDNHMTTDHRASTHAIQLYPGVQDEEMVEHTGREYEDVDKDQQFREREIISNDSQVQNTKQPNQNYNITKLSLSSSCACRSTVVRPFKCGLCWKAYSTICQLHEHLEYVHRETDTYLVDKITQTAFPRFKSSSVTTQTYPEIEQREVSVVDRTEDEIIDTELEAKFPRGEFLDSTREFDAKGHIEGNEEGLSKNAEPNECSFKEADNLKVLNAQEDVCVKNEVFTTENASEASNADNLEVLNVHENVLVKTEAFASDDDQTFQNDKCNSLNLREQKRIENGSAQRKNRSSVGNDVANNDSQTKPSHALASDDIGLHVKVEQRKNRSSVGNDVANNDSQTKPSQALASGDMGLHVKVEHGTQTFCNICDRQYASRTGYLRHLKLHKNPELCKCDKCDGKFTSAYHLHLHIREKHKVKAVVCQNCGDEFATTAAKHLHRRKCLDIKFPCTLKNCGKSYRRRPGLNTHLVNAHGRKAPLKCPVCEKGFCYRNDLKCHMSKHSRDEPCTCNVCGKVYKYSKDLKKHMRDHSDISKETELHVHSALSKEAELSVHSALSKEAKLRDHSALSKKAKLRDHSVLSKETELRDHSALSKEDKLRDHSALSKEAKLRDHSALSKEAKLRDHSALSKEAKLRDHSALSKEAKFKCEVCGKCLRYRTSLKAHMSTHSNEKPYICHVCGKAYAMQGSLRSHMFEHSDKGPFTCDICGNKYKHPRTLMLHRLEHTEGPRKFACTFEHCDKRYSSNFMLRAHMKTHTGEFPFPCDVCGKGFTGRKVLINHKLQMHSKERPWKCDQCPWAFQTKGGLSSHKKTHTVTQDQMLPCDVCGKAFSNKWNLAAHVRQHTGEKPFVCEICGAAFTHKVSLKNHMKVHKVGDTQSTQN